MKVAFACSFGTSLANSRLADAVQRILEKEDNKCVVIAQWEIARELEARNIFPQHVVEPKVDNTYLDTIDVWKEAKAYLSSEASVEVVIVAQPFIHGYYIERMIRKDGYAVCHEYDMEVGRIGFDSDSLQWWTRGPARLAFYVLLSVCGLAKYLR